MNRPYKTYETFFILLFASVFLFSCTKNFSKKNTDPRGITPEMLDYDNLYVGGFFKSMQENIFPVGGTGSNQTNAYQSVENLTGDVFAGYNGQTHNWNAAGDHLSYNFNIGWNGAAFNIFYAQMRTYDTIQKYSANAPDGLAISKILKVMAAHRTVDMYGPIPYFDLRSTGGTQGAKYDPMDAIYYSFFTDLDSAIAALKPFAQIGVKPLRLFDAVYGGDYAQWIKFANSLKLRLAMRIVYADPTKAKQYAEAAVNDSYGVIVDNANNAEMRGVSGSPYSNPLEGLTTAYNEARMSANMQSILTGYADPRRSAYFLESTYAGDAAGVYRGIRVGIAITDANALRYQTFSKLKTNFNVLWMPAAEVFFLRAEGALRGWSMGGTAQQLYETGIQKSFEQWKAGDATAYINNNTAKPADYTDPISSANNIVTGNPFKDTLVVKWNEASTFEVNLNRIILQKWIASYPNGQEAWSEFRRTGYPGIFPIRNDKSGGTIDINKQVKRIPYPNSQYQLNATNVNAALTLLGGPDNGGTKLWWDKKPNWRQ